MTLRTVCLEQSSLRASSERLTSLPLKRSSVYTESSLSAGVMS